MFGSNRCLRRRAKPKHALRQLRKSQASAWDDCMPCEDPNIIFQTTTKQHTRIQLSDFRAQLGQTLPTTDGLDRWRSRSASFGGIVVDNSQYYLRARHSCARERGGGRGGIFRHVPSPVSTVPPLFLHRPHPSHQCCLNFSALCTVVHRVRKTQARAEGDMRPPEGACGANFLRFSFQKHT